MKFNKLLEEQIRKYLDNDWLDQEQVKCFIDAVNTTYNKFESDEIGLPSSNKINEVKTAQFQSAVGNDAKAILLDGKGNFAYLDDQISKRKKMERELQNAEYDVTAAVTRLSQVITDLQYGVLLEDENRNILITNQMFCDMFGVPMAPEAMTGKGCADFAEQSKHLFKYPEKFIEQISELLKNRKPLIGDEIEMADGRILIRDYVPVFIEKKYKGHLWKYVDITQKKQIEKELKLLSLVASANETGVAFSDASGVIHWANEGFSKLTGYTHEDIIGKKAVELCMGPLTDMETVRGMLQCFYTGKGFNVEVIYYRKDRSWFWGRLKGQAVLDEHGNVQQYFALIDDITIEKEKEEQLSVLSLIAEDNSNAVIISDAEGAIRWVNKSFIKISGYTLDEVKGKKPGLMQGPETNLETIAYMKKQIAEGVPFDCEILNYTKAGVKVWLRVKAQPIRSKQGKVTGFFALEEDITEEKNEHEEVKQYESRFRKAFEKIGDNVWEHDFSTGRTYFSNTKEHLLGYKLDEFTDNANLWWDRTHPEDRVILEENDAKYKRGETDHHVLEYRIIHKDGSVRWVMDRGMVIEVKPDGTPLKIIGTHTDITERKQAEELLQREEKKYRSIIANMNLGLLEVDTDENVIFTNQSFCDMSGYDYDELIGKRASDIYIKEETIELIESKNEARKRGSLDAYEIAVKNKRGQLRWWLISGAPRFNDAGDLVGSIGIHLDITDQKQLETDLIEAREQAEESTRSKEVFLANMSHEIRTPMNAILGMTNQLGKTALDGKQRFYLETINSASENLLVIINDILDISKIEAGKLNLESIGFEPKAVLSRCMQVMRHKAEEKGLSITNSKTDEALSPVLMGDPYRLNQVLLNLISNAIKFTEKGSVDLACRVLKETPATQVVSIEVKDTGIGMDELFINTLFEKFSQEDVSVTRQYGGTGLGMSICKDLIELMGGQINVKSTKGAGTSIRFEVEFAKGSISNLPSKEKFSVNKDMLADKKILVVDDNNMNRLVAKTILRNYGAITTEAVNGKEAVELLQQNEIDLVLMDIQMPVMGGMEATKIIREEISRTVPVIALTANAIKGDNEKCIDGGMNAYLSKPFKEEDLLKIVSFWLNESNNSLPNQPATPNAGGRLYDLSAIRAISRGNEVFVVMMVNMFIEQKPAQVVEMQTKFDQNDYKGMAAIANKIRRAIDNMGIVSLKETIREIEKIGYAGTVDHSLPELLSKVSENIQQVIQALKKEFEGQLEVNA
ncbi:MAG: PAS domain S-box protein [Ferruginibacter sp.]